MSSWTYVHGMVEIEVPARTTAEAIFKAQTIVDHLPRITGSEGPARWAVAPVQGWLCSSNVDELGHCSNLGRRTRYYNAAARWNDYSFERQTKILLTLDGALRDRYFEQTLYETTKCLARLSSRVWVQHCLVRVSHWDKAYIFSDPDWIISQCENDWVSGLVNWKAIPGYGYPCDEEEENE